MTSESLRSQVEKRIAKLAEEADNTTTVSEYNRYTRVIHELEQVLTLIDEKAKELRTLQNEGLEMEHWAYRNALTLLVGNNRGESR